MRVIPQQAEDDAFPPQTYPAVGRGPDAFFLG